MKLPGLGQYQNATQSRTELHGHRVQWNREEHTTRHTAGRTHCRSQKGYPSRAEDLLAEAHSRVDGSSKKTKPRPDEEEKTLTKRVLPI